MPWLLAMEMSGGHVAEAGANRIKVAFSTDAWMRAGGAEQMLATLVTGLDQTVFQPVAVCVLYGAASDEYVRQARAVGADVLRFHMSLGRGPVVLLRLIQLALFLRRQKVDIVHSTGDRGIGGLAGFMARVPVRIYQIHNMEYWRALGGKSPARFLLRALFSRVVAVSHASADSYIEGSSSRRERVSVIHNGVDTVEAPMAAPLAPDAEWACREGPLLLTVARLVSEKAIDRLIAAMPLIRATVPSARLAVVGDGPLRQGLVAQAENLGLGGAVRFVGAQENVVWWLRRAAVFVLPSAAEGLGIAVIEAQANGVPVVVSGAGGLPEVVSDGETGLVVPLVAAGEGSAVLPTELARAVTNVLLDGQLAAKLRRQAYDAYRSHFTGHAMVARYENLYRELLCRVRRRESRP